MQGAPGAGGGGAGGGARSRPGPEAARPAAPAAGRRCPPPPSQPPPRPRPRPRCAQGCGLVVEAHIIDERSEWRTFGDKDKEGDDPSRVGGAANPLLDDGGLGTVIGRLQGDGGASFALNKMHMRQNGAARQLRGAFGGIAEMCSKLAQNESVKTGACQIYKDVRRARPRAAPSTPPPPPRHAL